MPGLFLIETNITTDNRGSFSKLYHEKIFLDSGMSFDIKEQFFTLSDKHVLRGMHFQLPPHEQCKMITCLTGRVLDVVLDLRIDSPTYGKTESFELAGDSGHLLLLPVGVAHGFLSLENDSGMLYNTSSMYALNFDYGIKWDSFDFNWPCNTPIVSERDHVHDPFHEFISPFKI